MSGYYSSEASVERALLDTVTNKGEVFYRQFGIGFYDGRYVDNSAIYRRDTWLSGEAERVHCLLQTSPHGMNLIGEVGCGKGAIVHGLRAIYRDEGRPYLDIDGHYQETPGNVVLKLIDRAVNSGADILYDSADYLVAKTKKVRRLSQDEHRTRSTLILEKLATVAQRGTKVITTSHDSKWRDDYFDPYLTTSWHQLTSMLSAYEVQGIFDGPVELGRFYEGNELTPEDAQYLAGLMNNPDFIDFLIQMKGDKKYLDWLKNIFFKYRTAKLLIADKFQEHIPVQEMLKNREVIGEEQFWEAYISFVFNKDYRILFHTRL